MSLRPTDIRRYLLGTATEEERSAVEQAYITDDAAFDALEADEEALIESYLAGDLATDEFERFERHYLASPLRRQRVEDTRRLTAAAARRGLHEHRRVHPVRRWRRPAAWAALAAAAVLIIAARTWLPPRPDPPPVADRIEAPAATAPSPAPAQKPPSTIVLALSPMTVRSAEGAPALSVPADADTVILRLEGEQPASRPGALHVVLRTVDGTESWQGSAKAPVSGEPGVLAEVELPASVLTPDDYIVELLDPGSSRSEPLASYFLRVRG